MTNKELREKLGPIWNALQADSCDLAQEIDPHDPTVQGLVDLASQLMGGESVLMTARLVEALRKRYPCTCPPYRKPGVFGRHLTGCPWDHLSGTLADLQDVLHVPDSVFEVELNYIGI